MKRQHVIRLALLTLACVLFLVAQAPAQVTTRQLVCPGRPIPAGWIKVDASTSPSSVAGDPMAANRVAWHPDMAPGYGTSQESE